MQLPSCQDVVLLFTSSLELLNGRETHRIARTVLGDSIVTVAVVTVALVKLLEL